MKLRSGLVTDPPTATHTEAQQPSKPKRTSPFPSDMEYAINRRCGLESNIKHPPPLATRYTRDHFSAGLISTDQPKLLITIPYELIYRILGFVQPEEYTGFACCCRLGLLLTNSRVEVEQPGLAAKYHMFVSYSAICAAVREVEASRKALAMYQQQFCAMPDLPIPTEDEPDL